MKNLKDIISEKLVLNKNSNSSIHSHEDKEFFYTCDIPELDDEIDNYLAKSHRNGFRVASLPATRKKSNGQNTNFYKFYCYLYYNGPAKRKDIIKFFFGDTNSQYAQVFTDLNALNIIVSEKGYKKAMPPKEWKL